MLSKGTIESTLEKVPETMPWYAWAPAHTYTHTHTCTHTCAHAWSPPRAFAKVSVLVYFGYIPVPYIKDFSGSAPVNEITFI